MTDYDKVIGTNPYPNYKGKMRIRVLANTVEFWIIAGSANTYTYRSPYSWNVNGQSGSSTFNYPQGKQWMKLRAFTVTTTQTVTFNLGATGTEGLGGPYTHSVVVDRGKIPEAPTPVARANVSARSFFTNFNDNGDGGSPILERQLLYGTNPTNSDHRISVPSNGEYTLTGLRPATTYYLWARVRNQYGWSPLSARREQKTYGAVRVRSGGSYKWAIPYIRSGGVWRIARPFTRRTGTWKEVG